MTNIIPGQQAPEFSLASMEGKNVSLTSLLKRGPVLAAFFKISCPVCQFTFPFLERLYKRYGGDEISFLGVSQDNWQSSKEFADEYGVTFPILLDSAPYPVSNAYGLTNVPTVFLIDTDHTVKISSMGFSKTDLQSMVQWFSEARKLSPAAFFLPDESVPEHRPG